MPGGTYFVQECPTCGRSLQVRVEYLGKRVTCKHCSGKFEAIDPSTMKLPAESGISLLDRADELLESVALSSTKLSNSGIGGSEQRESCQQASR